MKFIATKELGRLARWLRMLGFDTVYYDKEGKGALIIQSLRDDRTIITRTKEKIAALKKKTIIIASENVKEQLREIVEKAELKIEEEKMFTRCTLCNEELRGADKEEIKEFVPERVYKEQKNFKQCPSCRKVYWRGSHLENIKKVVSSQLPVKN